MASSCRPSSTFWGGGEFLTVQGRPAEVPFVSGGSVSKVSRASATGICKSTGPPSPALQGLLRPGLQHADGRAAPGLWESSGHLGFYGAGSLVDLPHFRRRADAELHEGFLLMNETLNPRDGVMVYTSPRYDTQEGDRYIRGEGRRPVVSWTREADFFCDTSDGLQSESCAEGYVCEETSNSSEGMWFPCREAMCDFATTPTWICSRLPRSSRTCARPGISARTGPA